jgi:hypothetical protein
VRPSRSYVRPAASKGGATDGGYRHREPTMDRTFRSAPTRSAPQDHAPSRSAPRASAPRSGGGGGNRGGGRRH